MIDIHAHIIHQVDDGSSSLLSSLEMAKNLRLEGVTSAILTPHLRGSFNAKKEQILSQFHILKEQLEKENIDINVYLGQEAYITKEYKTLIKDGTIIPLNQTKFILCEFDFKKESEISDIVYEIKTMGYKPIVAHLERYSYADLDMAFDIKECGGYIQVNASSIVNPVDGKQKKLIKNLFKEDLVDFVASDAHEFRALCMQKAYAYVEKKFGTERAQRVFIENAKEIIKG